MDGHASRVFAVRYHPSDPTSFLSAGWDDTVQVGGTPGLCYKTILIYTVNGEQIIFSQRLWIALIPHSSGTQDRVALLGKGGIVV